MSEIRILKACCIYNRTIMHACFFIRDFMEFMLYCHENNYVLPAERFFSSLFAENLTYFRDRQGYKTYWIFF